MRPDAEMSRGWLPAFGAAAALPVVMMLLPGPAVDPLLMVLGALMVVGALAAVALLPWPRLSDWWLLVPVVGYVAGIAVLRHAGGGNASGVGPLVIVPVVWVALVGTRRTLAVASLGPAAAYWLPIVLSGPAMYPDSGWRIGALFGVMGWLLGLPVLRLRDGLAGQAARLHALALEDALTGLPNRRAWEQHVERELERCGRAEQRLCLALIDVDDFKGFNDRGGHAAGDELLREVAGTWADALRRGDVLARLGGDEFGVLLPAASLDEATQVLERVRSKTPSATCSAGVVLWDGAEGPDALVERADRLLYDAKAGGRDRVHAAAA